MRWIVDGMNVIGTRPDGWWKDRHGAMTRLVDLLERFSAATGEDVTVVFEQPPSPPIASPLVEVAHAPRPEADAADKEFDAKKKGLDTLKVELIKTTKDPSKSADEIKAKTGAPLDVSAVS
jgi:hypothetical protein